MKNTLFSALVSLGVHELSGRDAWRRLVMVRNFSQVPPRTESTVMGFKFVVHDGRGTPRWFGRCGWDTLASMRTECALLEALAKDPLTARHVPESRATAMGETIVHVSRHLGAVAYDRRLSTRSAAVWARDLDEILGLSEQMMTRVGDTVAAAMRSDPLPHRRAQLERDLVLLEQRGVDAGIVAWLRDSLSSSLECLPVALQHGDLWPANVLRAEDRWWLIDFSECGIMWTPGYDLFLLLVNGPAGFDTSWIMPTRDAARTQWNEVRRNTIGNFAQRHGYDGHTMGVLLLHFLVRLTAHRMRPGLSAELSRHWCAELVRVERYLSRTGTFDRVFDPR